jgi:hypothetical protein
MLPLAESAKKVSFSFLQCSQVHSL